MIRLIFKLIIISTVSCQKKMANTFNKKKITEDIELMFQLYHSDIREDGLLAEFNYLDKSDDFFWVPPGYNSALSYDSVETILRMNAQALSSVEFSWDTLNIYPLSNEIATYSGIVSGVMIDTAGNELRMSIIESGTLIKRNSGWKLLSGQSAVVDDAKNKY